MRNYVLTFFLINASIWTAMMLQGSTGSRLAFLRNIAGPLVCMVPILSLQYRVLLRLYPHVVLEILVHYASFVLFLFLSGFLMSVGQQVGSASARNPLGWFDGGVRVAVMGQFIGIVPFAVVVVIYLALRSRFFH